MAFVIHQLIRQHKTLVLFLFALSLDLSLGAPYRNNVTSEGIWGSCPIVYKGLPNVLVTVGDAVEFDIPEDAFKGNFTFVQVKTKSEGELPRWLSYNSSEHLFEGSPGQQDVGTMEIHIVVSCDQCPSSCANATSRFNIIVRSEDTSVSPKPPNKPPILVKPLGRLVIGLGQHFQLRIPSDTFMDAEDGDTRSLKLSLYHQSRIDLPQNFWLQLNTTSQTIYAIPLAKDFRAHPIELVLAATDSGGLVVMDTISVVLNAGPLKDFSHNFVLTLDAEESFFMATPNNLIVLVTKLRNYFTDTSPESVSILSVNKGSVIVSWANNTLSKTKCQKHEISQLYNQISDGQDGVNSNFFSSMLPEFYVSKVGFRYRGICVPSPVNPTGATTGEIEAEPSRHGMEWYQVVLPALVVIFAILLLLFVGLICFRRFRHRGKTVLRSEKDEFEEFGQPFEMELNEMNGKPCRPLVLEGDPGDNPVSGDWVDERPPPPNYGDPDGKRVSQPLDYNQPVQPSYDNGAYQPPPVYRIPPTYSSPGQSHA